MRAQDRDRTAQTLVHELVELRRISNAVMSHGSFGLDAEGSVFHSPVRNRLAGVRLEIVFQSDATPTGDNP